MTWTINIQTSFNGGTSCKFVNYNTGAVHAYDVTIPIDGTGGATYNTYYYSCTNPLNGHVVAYTHECSVSGSTNLYKKFLYWAGPGNSPVVCDAPSGFEIRAASFGPNTGTLYLTCRRTSDNMGCVLFSATPQSSTSYAYIKNASLTPLTWSFLGGGIAGVQAARFPGAAFGNYQGIVLCSTMSGHCCLTFEDSASNLSTFSKSYLDSNILSTDVYTADSFVDASGNAFAFASNIYGSALYFAQALYNAGTVNRYTVNTGISGSIKDAICPSQGSVLFFMDDNYTLKTYLLSVAPISGTKSLIGSNTTSCSVSAYNGMAAKKSDGTSIIFLEKDQPSYYTFSKTGVYQSTASVLGTIWADYWAGQQQAESFAYTLTFPSAPTGISATAASSTSITLNWNSLAGATVNIYNASDTLLASNVSGTSYSHTSLSAGTQYGYKLCYTDGVETSPKTAAFYKYTLCAAPASFSTPVLNASSALVLCPTVTGGSSYVATASQGAYSQTLETTSPNGTGFAFSGMTSQTTYNLSIQARNPDGVLSTNAVTGTFATVALPTPVFGAASNKTASQFQVNLSSPLAGTATILVRTKSLVTVLPETTMTGQTYLVTGLSALTPYDVTVTYSDSGGSSSATTEISTVDVVQPTLSFSNISISGFQADTNSIVTGTATITVMQGATPVVSETTMTGTTYPVSGLSQNTAYDVTIRFTDGGASKTVTNTVTTLENTYSFTNLAANVSGGVVSISFASVADATAYYVYYKTHADGDYDGTGLHLDGKAPQTGVITATLADVTNVGGIVTIPLYGAVAGTTYWFGLSAMVSGTETGKDKSLSPVSVTFGSGVTGVTPTYDSATNIIHLSWNKSPGDNATTAYRIYYENTYGANDGNSLKLSAEGAVMPSPITIQVSSLADPANPAVDLYGTVRGLSYWFYVKPVDANGMEGTAVVGTRNISVPVASGDGSALLAMPESVTVAVNQATRQINLNWN